MLHLLFSITLKRNNQHSTKKPTHSKENQRKCPARPSARSSNLKWYFIKLISKNTPGILLVVITLSLVKPIGVLHVMYHRKGFYCYVNIGNRKVLTLCHSSIYTSGRMAKKDARQGRTKLFKLATGTHLLPINPISSVPVSFESFF